MDGTNCTINDDLMRFVNGVSLFGATLTKEEGSIYSGVQRREGEFTDPLIFCLAGEFLVFRWHIPFNRSANFVFSKRACGSRNNEVVEHVVSYLHPVYISIQSFIELSIPKSS